MRAYYVSTYKEDSALLQLSRLVLFITTEALSGLCDIINAVK